VLLIMVTDPTSPVFKSTVRKKRPLPARLRRDASRDFVGFTSLSRRAGGALGAAYSASVGAVQANSAAIMRGINRDISVNRISI
jgi:hypothetical protein